MDITKNIVTLLLVVLFPILFYYNNVLAFPASDQSIYARCIGPCPRYAVPHWCENECLSRKYMAGGECAFIEGEGPTPRCCCINL
ncbi:unnamed protein product [Arabidopsis thaliana]|uniref:Putative defensin-like protein 101 n=2 Tax=Arabidopsis thaliana TaxID=3702 RepID=DF101_ARATH|nr:Defensin-like (DEFL) family protein [Arabidopsis thaliana]Q2V337.1 RecName: Full=Putative defensin-like protein 101; Flags: Precursor [Arabidopsis thaliana]AED93784.1 Defensin-like (DEFL) family protein [Arabidopsis thaliana]VYS68163.1 unnamed protein product [Arabidopsis thaliana]|eukprot:NP_001031961.1 Defensin-like (DEFL) family protein [Arabidopsis thaliana]